MGTDIQKYQGNDSLDQQNTMRQRKALEKRWTTERVDTITEIIMKARLTADQAPPVGLAKVSMAGAWAEVLADIPSDCLLDYYVRAAKAKTNGFAVNALDIITEWNKPPKPPASKEL